MKRKIIACFAVLMLGVTTVSAKISDHSGTNMSGFDIGTKNISAKVMQYAEYFKREGDRYGIDPNILAAICMQESAGTNYSYREDGSSYPAWGIMQIEYTHEKSFANFGENRDGIRWTLADRLDPEKSIAYAAYLLSESLYKYDSDYIKMIQAYNFGNTVLDRIIGAVGDDWLSERVNAAKYADNWKYSKYGDALYVEHVLAYYENAMEYSGAKVRIDDKLVKFSEQHPIIDNGYTLIPIRAVSETLGADVEWDGDAGIVTITKSDDAIILAIGSSTAYVNNDRYELECSAEVVNGRTLVPIRFVAEAFGNTVEWDGESRTVLIS